MSGFEVIPAVDIRGGRCVRLEQGLAERETVYANDPVEAARLWERSGAGRLHVVDLDGAFSGRSANFDVVQRVIQAVDIPVEVGGGIRDAATARSYLRAGASWVIFGTRAAEDPGAFAEAASELPGRVILGLDCREGMVRTAGWTQAAEFSAEELIGRLAGAPLAAVIFTDVARDGMLSGPNFDSLEAVAKASPWPTIASGGVTTTGQLRRLASMKLVGAIVGQALYRGTLEFSAALAAAQAGLRERAD
jgi:phosphoribosylformimino-5-aminoimidazole carboxamide ribotide isomerase